MNKQYLPIYLVAVGILILGFLGFISLKKEIDHVNSKVEISRVGAPTDNTTEKSLEPRISTIEKEIESLQKYVDQKASDDASQKEETSYRSGDKDFSVKCKNIDNVSAADLFKKPYYKNLSQALAKTTVKIPPPKSNSIVPATTILDFPWGTSNSIVEGVCEDNGIVYLIGIFQPEMTDIFYMVGEFDTSKNTLVFTTTDDMFFFLKEVQKEGDVLNFLPDTDVCAGEGDFFVKCDSNSSDKVHKSSKPGFQYNLTTKKFTILDSKIINK